MSWGLRSPRDHLGSQRKLQGSCHNNDTRIYFLSDLVLNKSNDSKRKKKDSHKYTLYYIGVISFIHTSWACLNANQVDTIVMVFLQFLQRAPICLNNIFVQYKYTIRKVNNKYLKKKKRKKQKPI